MLFIFPHCCYYFFIFILLLEEESEGVSAKLGAVLEGSVHVVAAAGDATSPLHVVRNECAHGLEDLHGGGAHLLVVGGATVGHGGHDFPFHLVSDVRTEVLPRIDVERGPAVDVALDKTRHAKEPDRDSMHDDVALDHFIEQVGDVILLDAGAAALVTGRAVLAGRETLLRKDNLVDFDLDVLVALGCLGETLAVGCEHLISVPVDVGTTEDSEHLNDRHLYLYLCLYLFEKNFNYYYYYY